jgi:hypothetical protein
MKKIIIVLMLCFSATLTFSQTCEYCNGADATLTASPGPAGFTYNWSTGATTQAITVTAGIYTVTVTETATGCTGEATYTITECDPIVVNASGTNNNACNTPNGQVTAAPTGGCTGDTFTYNWENSAMVNVGTSQTVTGLTGDSYSVTVTSSSGCTSVGVTTIGDDSPAVNATINCVAN